jgi:uncharacterized protein YbjT (DUF2867 family)
MRTAIIIGGTGLVGKELIAQLLNNPTYSAIHVLLRKTLHIDHPKLHQHLIDFDNMNRFADLMKGDDAFCCLGTTMKQAGSRESFYKVDFEYVNNFARLTAQNGVKNFALVSALGASQQSLFYYSQVKGAIEKAVREKAFQAILIVRPSLLIGNRAEKRLGEDIGIAIENIFKPIIPAKYRGIEASKVANAMIKTLAQNPIGTIILESEQLQSF